METAGFVKTMTTLRLCVGNRARGDPRDDARRIIEGWILGQVNPCS